MNKINKCAICNKKFLKIIDLGMHPCADTFLSSKIKAKALPRFKLKVGYCNCFHLTAINKVSGFERYQKFKWRGLRGLALPLPGPSPRELGGPLRILRPPPSPLPKTLPA